MKKNITVFGLNFKGLDKEKILKFHEKEIKIVTTVNSEFIINANEGNDRLKYIINNTLSTFDGQIPYLIARILNYRAKFQKISGSDLIYDLIDKSKKEGLKLFFLGGMEESNKAAVEKLEREGVSVDGYSPVFEDYPFSEQWSIEVQNRITEFKPDIIVVCFGAIKQEYWIDDNKVFLQNHGIRFAYGAGGTVDFVSGSKTRAPRFVQVLGLEGGFRLLIEPKLFRFFRLIKSVKVFKHMFK